MALRGLRAGGDGRPVLRSYHRSSVLISLSKIALLLLAVTNSLLFVFHFVLRWQIVDISMNTP